MLNKVQTVPKGKSSSAGKTKKNKIQKESKTASQGPPEFNHDDIEKALFDRARGYEYEEETITGEGKDKVKRVVKKFAIPDVTACIFWLRNCLPDKWKDPKDIDNDKQSMKDFLEHYYEEE